MLDAFIKFLAQNPKDTVLLAALSGLLGAFLKFIFDEWSAKNKARRDMITNVTNSVNELAKNYYWKLANNASTLAFFFTDYLDKRQELQLQQDPPAKLRERLDALIEKTANDSFFYYAHLVKLTYRFDWIAGSTFLLRDYWAGQSIRNIQNALRLVLDLEQQVVEYVDPLDKDGKPTESSPSYLLNEPKLADAREKYRRVFHDEQKLTDAKKYLKACGDLFNYELAKLYRDWFKNWFGRVPTNPPLLRLAISDSFAAETLDTIRKMADESRRTGYAIAPLTSASTPRPFQPMQEPQKTRGGDQPSRRPSERAERKEPPDGEQRKAPPQQPNTGPLSLEAHAK